MITESTSTTTSTTSIACNHDSCPLSFVGDGYCDDQCNCIERNFDGGDCCGPNVDTDFCQECECKQ